MIGGVVSNYLPRHASTEEKKFDKKNTKKKNIPHCMISDEVIAIRFHIYMDQ